MRSSCTACGWPTVLHVFVLPLGPPPRATLDRPAGRRGGVRGEFGPNSWVLLIWDVVPGGAPSVSSECVCYRECFFCRAGVRATVLRWTMVGVAISHLSC